LRLVCNFIENVLYYAYRSTTKPFDPDHFKDAFRDQGVDWFINYKTIKSGLSDIFKLKQEHREALYIAFKEDIDFVKQMDCPDYRMKFPDLPKCVKKVAKPFFEALYDEVLGGSTGFRMKGLSLPYLKRVDVRKGCFEANRKADGHFNSVCPACLGEIEVTEEDGYADLDHYLTKSIYPTLSVSPDNLIPLCKTCNENVKGAEDPLKNHLEAGGMLHLFFPYHRPGLNSIKVGIHKEEVNEQFIVGAVEGKESENTRVANFEALFDLNKRWSGKINSSLHETVRSHVISEFIDQEEQMTELLVQKKLHKMFKAEMRTHGTVPDSYLLAQYVNILMINHDQFVGFYKDVAKTLELEQGVR